MKRIASRSGWSPRPERRGLARKTLGTPLRSNLIVQSGSIHLGRIQLGGMACLILSTFLVLMITGQAVAAESEPNGEPAPGVSLPPLEPASDNTETNEQDETTESEAARGFALDGDLGRMARTVGFFAAISLAPIALLMTTAFVRINIVLLLLRQALGSPQVPGNQVMTALALLLTTVVMAPAARTVYEQAIQPLAEGDLEIEEAWKAGSEPIKMFMITQIRQTGHEHYLEDFQALALERGTGLEVEEDGSPPFLIVAPAFLISELTTALWIGFLIYIPFLLIDLVATSVLAATGLIMMPPAQVALPLKLALFVIADGWWLIADALVRTFAMGTTGTS